jgi:methylmalonyl-CoA mutase
LNPFPARSEADWRQAAEAALKGVALEKLTSITSDGVALGPLPAAPEGARAFRGESGPWKALSRVDHPSAQDFNAQALEDLENGADGLDIVFAGSGAAYGFGLRDAGPASLQKAFDGVPFNAGARFHLDVANAGQCEAFAALVERSGAEAAIAFGLDPLGRRARSGAADPVEGALRATADSLRGRGFAGPFVAADARCVHDAGGTPAQELAFALSAGLSYLRTLEDPTTIEFRLAADADQIATLAKFRAMRLLWGRVGQACGLTPEPIRLSAYSAWRMMTAVEPYVNVMRATMAAFAAGLGGADSVTLLPFSQAAGLPDAFARRLARNTQLVELREARLGAVADPAAGAGGFEALTAGLCEKAWALFQSFEAAGGLEKALDQGVVQTAVNAAAAVLKRDVARGKTPLTGVSAHPHLDADPVAVLPNEAAPAAVDAPGAVAPFRLSEPFERLRKAALRGGPSVFLAAIGPRSAHLPRLGFARETFTAGGVPVIAGAGAEGADKLAEEFRRSGAPIACLCGSDEAYTEHAEAVAAALRAAGARALYLAGRPGERETAWRAAGIDGFVFVGADLVAALADAVGRAAG